MMQTKIETPPEWPRLEEELDPEVVKRADECLVNPKSALPGLWK